MVQKHAGPASRLSKPSPQIVAYGGSVGDAVLHQLGQSSTTGFQSFGKFGVGVQRFGVSKVQPSDAESFAAQLVGNPFPVVRGHGGDQSLKIPLKNEGQKILMNPITIPMATPINFHLTNDE